MDKATALEREMKRRQANQQPQDPSTWERIKRLFGKDEGQAWADNANALLPESVSGREAVMKKRKQDQMMDEMWRNSGR
jgi:hypothetical protein